MSLTEEKKLSLREQYNQGLLKPKKEIVPTPKLLDQHVKEIGPKLIKKGRGRPKILDGAGKPEKKPRTKVITRDDIEKMRSMVQPVLLEPASAADAPELLPAPSALSAQEFDEQQVARVEILMLKGNRDEKKIMTDLNLPSLIITRTYMRRVHARWEITGGGGQLKRYRGELLNRLDLIEGQLWATASTTRDERTNVICMQQLMALNKQRQDVFGLTPDAINKLITITEEGNEVVARMNKQVKMVEMLSRFSELLLEGKNKEGKPLIEKTYPLTPAEPLPELPKENLEQVVQRAAQVIEGENHEPRKDINAKPDYRVRVRTRNKSE